MPNALTHSILTRAALMLLKLDVENYKNLIVDYCNYPDRGAEVAKYDLPTDGIQFHYLPDSTVNELYRYWGRENGVLKACRPFVNENFHHVTAGAKRYLDLALTNFQNGSGEEAQKYLGWVLHVLEDATFGLHTLEGFMGSDPFILDRLSGKAVSDMLAAIQLAEMPQLPEYSPKSLGSSIDEMVMRIYSGYCRVSADSRQCCFRYAMNKIYGKDSSGQEVQRMFENAVKLCADVVCSVLSLSENITLPRPAAVSLNEIEPYQFPFGGCNGYRYRPYSVNFALDVNSQPMALKTVDKEYVDGVAFAAHHEGALLYFIGENVFSKFTCRIGLHPEYPMEKSVHIAVLNDGKIVEEFSLNSDRPVLDLMIDHPCNKFGFAFRCSPTGGETVVIGEPQLHY